ncbi:hypothetical protein [Streptomyces sp. CB02460]|uniref:hypothetical protein n=1 Tax=Streptomyces sp. CB02460 TaxID=1703941 RepID=UPI001F5B12B7|nr:hypothetical protein [Streptomyces sp. CB02460]
MILTRGARVTGAVLSAVLVVIVAGWLIRDVDAIGFGQLWRNWSGLYDIHIQSVPTTSATDLVLFVVYVAVTVAALRTASAASALVVAGVVTLTVRLPGLWTIGSRRMEAVYSDELRSRALICAFVAVAAAAAMIIAAGAGRRPPVDSYERTPTGPGPGTGVLTFLALSAAGAVLIAWEIRQIVRDPEFFPDWYVGGDRVAQYLTGPPPGWATVMLALLCVFAGISAAARARHARPFGLVAAAVLLPGGVFGVVRIVHYDMLEHFADLSTELQLSLLSSFFQVFAALAALIALALPGPVRAPGQDPWSGSGPGWGPAPATPPPYPGQRPGYGYPQGGGGFGPPPPPSQPPPGW